MVGLYLSFDVYLQSLIKLVPPARTKKKKKEIGFLFIYLFKVVGSYYLREFGNYSVGGGGLHSV